MSLTIEARYDLSLLKVLIIDDSENMQKLVKTILSALGVEQMEQSPDGLRAYEILGWFEPDLLICDWNMSPIDGITFTRKVRRSPDSPNPYVPIIILSGHSEKSRVTEARDAGANLFLTKPISVKTLSDRIQMLIDNPQPFVRTEGYFGPDRRRQDMGPPPGILERRKPDGR